MTPAKCLKLFGNRHLTEYEKSEILTSLKPTTSERGLRKFRIRSLPFIKTSPSMATESPPKTDLIELTKNKKIRTAAAMTTKGTPRF